MPKIVAILHVEDTREWVQGPDDRWYAIPGSGEPRACDRCQRPHEVHATVELDDGAAIVVGTGCMRGEDAALVRAVRSADRAAKKARRAQFEGKKRRKLADAYEAAWAQVLELDLPPVTTCVEQKPDGDVTILRMGDASVWHLRPEISEQDLQERTDVLVRTWRERRLSEMGIGYQHRMAFNWPTDR
jgi:hypothetical protein